MQTTSSGGETTQVQNGKLAIDEANNRLTYHNGTVYRMLIGEDPETGEPIIAISKVGEDVFEALSE